MFRLVCILILISATAKQLFAQNLYVGTSAGFTIPILNEQYPQQEKINLDEGVHTATFNRERSNLGSGSMLNLHAGIRVYKQLFMELGIGTTFAQSQQFFSVLEEQSGGGRIVNNEYRRLIQNEHTFRFLYLAPTFIAPITQKLNMHMRSGLMLAQATMQSQIQMSVQERNSRLVQTSSANIAYDGAAQPGLMMQLGAGYRVRNRIQINADFTFHAVSYRVNEVAVTNRMASGIPQPDLMFDYSGSTRHYSASSSGYSPAASPRHLFSGGGIQLSVQYLFDKKNR